MSQSNRATVYRWGELESDEPMALLSRKRVIGEQAMISRVVLQKGCVVPRHAHEMGPTDFRWARLTAVILEFSRCQLLHLRSLELPPGPLLYRLELEDS